MIGVWLHQELWRARFGVVPRVVFGLLPLLLLPVLRPMGTEALRLDGRPDLDGSLILGPGLATMFAIVSLVFLGRTCFDERQWGTARRHEASGSYGSSALVAKAVVNWAALVVQQAVLFLAFWLLFGFRPAAGWIWFVPLVAVGMASIVALGMLVFSLARSISEFNLLPFVGSVLLVGLGSGLTPQRFSPEWARSIGPAFPTTHFLGELHDLAVDGTASGAMGATLTIALMTVAIVAMTMIAHRVLPRAGR